MKKTKNILSVLMAAMMGFTVMTTPIYAEQETAGEAPEVTEEQAAEEPETPEEETKEPEAAPEVTEEPAETPEVKEEPKEVIQPEETPEINEETEKTEEQEEEPKVAEEEPVTTVTPDPVTFNGVTVTVSYDSDAFGGKNVTLVVGEAGNTEKAALDELEDEYKAIDISFLDENGEKVQPAEGKKVNVSLKAEGVQASGEYGVYHVDADGVISYIKANNETTDEVTEKVKVGETTKTVEVPAETETVTVKDYKTEKYTAYETKTKKVNVPAKYGYRYILKYKKNGKKVKASVANPILKKAKKDKNGKPKVSSKKYKVAKEKYVVQKAYTKTVTEKVPVTKTRKVQSGTHTETKIIKEAYSYEVKEDVYEDVTFSDVESSFTAYSFSTYALVWKEGEEDKTATIHWGTYVDGVFEELTTSTTIDSTASNVKLDIIIDAEKYYFVGAEYVAAEGADPVNLSSTTIKKANDGTWQMNLEGSNQPVTIADGSNIYVNYAPYGEGGYTPPPRPTADVLAPETEKTVTDNGNGTYTIQLDIEGKQDETVTQIGANVIIVMDITQSMSNNMPRESSSRMAAAKRALNTLITTLDPDTNTINFTAVNFGNSANYSNGVNWTTTTSQMRNYVTGLPNNPSDLGTNWGAGLQGGIARVNQANERDNLKNNETYVIFVTDGNPNGWVENGRYRQRGSGQFIQEAYDYAVPYANTLGESCHFYGVFVGDADGYTHLNDLITGAQGVKTINGTNSAAIESEFAEIAQTIVDNLGAGSVEVDDGIPTLSNVSANVSAGEAGGFEYFITPKNGTQTKWADAPGATYSNTNGVTWNLSEAGTLQDGWIYTLKFTVWPSQAAYDLIADLNNGKIDFDDLTEEQQASIDGSKTDGYTLKTNTHLYTTFKDLDGKEYREINDAKAKAMDLPTETISIEKIWHNWLDSRNNVDIEGLQMVLSRDNQEYLEFDVASPTWKADGIYISVGQIVDGEIKETGHDYYVTEKAKEDNDKTEYWEVNSPVYHPMVVNGTMKLFIQDDTAADPAFELGSHKYVEAESTAGTLQAINERTSWLNLIKHVEGDDAPEDTLFTYTIKITEPSEEDFLFSVFGDGVQYRDDLVHSSNVQPWIDPTTNNTYYAVNNDEEFTISVKKEWSVRFLDLETGTTYSITETRSDIPEGFAFKEAKHTETWYVGRDSSGRTPAEGYPIVTTKDNSPTDNGAAIDDVTVTGTINQTNTDYTVEYTNEYLGYFYVYHSANNTVERFPMVVNGTKVTDFNIFERTIEGTFYGGYYSDYAGKSSGFDAKTLDYSGSTPPKDAGGTAYTYTYIKDSSRGAWTYGNAYDVNGKAMDPGKDEVYYLKEVPTAYLLPYTHYTYNKSDKVIRNMWYLTAIDDLCYKEAGFFVETIDADGKISETKIVDTLTITNTTGGATVTLSPSSVFGNKGGAGNGVQAGYLTYWDAKAKIAENATSIFTPYWLTKDGIYVNGTQTRTIRFNNGKVGSGGMRITDADVTELYPDIE